jgi:hypothetical protein
MPVTYRLDTSAEVVLATAHGIVTDDEFLAYATRMVNDPLIDPAVDQLLDLRDVDDAAVMTDTIRRVAEIFRGFDPIPARSKLAIVASKDLLFGMARMYEVYRDRDEASIRVFRDIDEARRWLGLVESAATGSNEV